MSALTLVDQRYTPPALPAEARRVASVSLLPSVERDIAVALDRARLSHHVGIAPDSWQAELLRCTDQRVLLNTSRQVGKSTTTATLAVHTAIYEPGAIILLLSPSLRQSGQLFAKVKWVLKRLGNDFAQAETDNALSVRLTNGSEIYSLPGRGATVRGFSAVTLIIVDEAAFVADELYSAVSPMLAVSRGRLVLLSTPFGKRGFFYEQWANGGDDWRRFEVKAEDCPRIPAAFLASERRMLGPLFEQEYGCQFLDLAMSMFRSEDIAAALTSDMETLFDFSEVA